MTEQPTHASIQALGRSLATAISRFCQPNPHDDGATTLLDRPEVLQLYCAALQGVAASNNVHVQPGKVVERALQLVVHTLAIDAARVQALEASLGGDAGTGQEAGQ